MKPLSFKVTSDHFRLCVFLSLLWVVTDSNATPAPASTPASTPTQTSTPSTTLSTTMTITTEATTTTAPPTTTTTTPPTTKPPPDNVKDVRVSSQNESSITLVWDKVDNILTYFLKYNNEGLKVVPINALEAGPSVTHVVSSLTAGIEYDFTLFTSSEGGNSTGYKFQAVTAPLNAEDFQSVDQTETSVTLQWKKVGNFNYTLVLNEKEINITASEGSEPETRTISGLTSGTRHEFTLYTLFKEARSSGVPTTAFTIPLNANGFKSVNQSETSITLQWEKVNNVSNYRLVFNGKTINITASEEDPVTHIVSDLTNTTRYNFTLFTVFENVTSRGVNIIAFTAPPDAEGFKSVGQSETNITLQWKRVNDFVNYALVYFGKEINISLTEEEPIKYTVPELTSGTKYDFTLYSVFETVRSSGVKHSAPTAPKNVPDMNLLTRNESSITLVWDKVNDISTYLLQYHKEGHPEVDTIPAPVGGSSVTHVVSSLTAGTIYHFTLITQFEGVNSTGYRFDAVTAPLNAKQFKAVRQNETSITLQWEKVNGVLNYTLEFNETMINITVSEEDPMTYTVSDLESMTRYVFTLFAVFENARSSGINTIAFTAPRNTEKFESVEQNETSITLQWKQVNKVLSYTLMFNKMEINVAASTELQVKHTVTELKSGTKYHFTLYSLFETVRSSGVNYSAPTAPRNTQEVKAVGQNETSITLQWEKVNDILSYTLVFSETVINITALEGLKNVTHTVSELTSGTKYNFNLFTVFENVRSSGVYHSAVTAPGNVNNVTVVTQNESSITLKWDKVNDISTYFLQHDNNGSFIEVNQEASVTYEVSSLNAGTKYNFTLITRFEKVNSTGFSFCAVTVPSMVPLVNVTERSVTSINLTWQNVNKDWNYFLLIDGGITQSHRDQDPDVVSRSVTSLQPGTAYPFSVITEFSGHNSTAYKGFTVTKIDCASVSWRVTNSSIQGVVEGLFSNATVTNQSQIHVSPGGSNVTFTDLYPGATYNMSLVYEKDSMSFSQCNHTLTIMPPMLSAHCKYWAAGYSILIVWNEPEGVWTDVDVNVMGDSHIVADNGQRQLTIHGVQPARTYKVSLTSLSGPERSYEFVFQCSTDPRGVIAGSVFAVLLFAILVCLAVFIFLKRPDIIRKKSFIGGSRQANKKCKAISVAKFPDHFAQLSADENRGFTQEYDSLAPVGTEQTRKAAGLPENKTRNRFNNVQPYDWCRVKLTSSSHNGTSDYINASYMPGYNSNREFIATQGPLPATVDDFWRMIWEQRVKGIVMVTNCTENGRIKCERYWPADSQPCPYGELLVTVSSEQQQPNWTLREFRLKQRNTSEERTVKHFHFTAWPDHGVPQGTEVLIQFRGLVRQHIESAGTGAPTVVHCSAGVGRTGTIIALDVLLQQLAKQRAVGIKGFVYKMRLSRPYMVQTESQYVFLHQCIMDSLEPREKTEENIYENADMIYANATALREFHSANA
ncbi:receptor-type tyrosine-protein phosphatase H-like isoform X2 [Epinephelus moara]|uniref:receptor-type tyrosine-protein phosphatase H-like isoform X2 n=1 Tax=Epinephelus moara TaxID=300413 RepID=UPI00214E3B93|nr:receptor-type tyrosine-protein phosphatase H-like isoform X2 [Epinephelus moara]